MKEKEHLPLLGVGPIIIAVQVMITMLIIEIIFVIALFVEAHMFIASRQ